LVSRGVYLKKAESISETNAKSWGIRKDSRVTIGFGSVSILGPDSLDALVQDPARLRLLRNSANFNPVPDDQFGD
jgi:hypothetical protein